MPVGKATKRVRQFKPAMGSEDGIHLLVSTRALIVECLGFQKGFTTQKLEMGRRGFAAKAEEGLWVSSRTHPNEL